MTADAWQEVIADMSARRELGLARYGKPVRPGDGEDYGRHAYEELLDLLVYWRAFRAERDALDLEIEVLGRRVADLTARVRELEGLNRSLAERVAAQAELLSRRAERPAEPLPPSNGNQTDPREGGGGEGRTQTQPGTPAPALPRS